MIAFWILAPISVLAALGLLFARKAVHAALGLAVVMISLAILYAVQDAPFLFAVQIIVYTGAIMILFLFVLMLVGRDSSDSVVETLRGQRVAAILVGIGFAGLVGAGIARATQGHVTPTLSAADGNANNIPAIAELLFTRSLLAFEVTSALLITAALGAMVLAHRERLSPKLTQAEWAVRRVRENKDVAGLPAPGVYARHNAVDTPALLPDGTPSDKSVSRVLVARDQVASADGFKDVERYIEREIEEGRS
jgi:NADH-quinone oxidoreductase subunit J